MEIIKKHAAKIQAPKKRDFGTVWKYISDQVNTIDSLTANQKRLLRDNLQHMLIQHCTNLYTDSYKTVHEQTFTMLCDTINNAETRTKKINDLEQQAGIRENAKYGRIITTENTGLPDYVTQILSDYQGESLLCSYYTMLNAKAVEEGNKTSETISTCLKKWKDGLIGENDYQDNFLIEQYAQVLGLENAYVFNKYPLKEDYYALYKCRKTDNENPIAFAKTIDKLKTFFKEQMPLDGKPIHFILNSGLHWTLLSVINPGTPEMEMIHLNSTNGQLDASSNVLPLIKKLVEIIPAPQQQDGEAKKEEPEEEITVVDVSEKQSPITKAQEPEKEKNTTNFFSQWSTNKTVATVAVAAVCTVGAWYLYSWLTHK